MMHEQSGTQGHGIEAEKDIESGCERTTVVTVVNLNDSSRGATRCMKLVTGIILVTAVVGVGMLFRTRGSDPVEPLATVLDVSGVDQPEIPYLRSVLTKLSERDSRAELCVAFLDRFTECRKAPGPLSIDSIKRSDKEMEMDHEMFFYANDFSKQEAAFSAEERTTLHFITQLHGFLDISQKLDDGTHFSYGREEIRTEHHKECLRLARTQLGQVRSEFYPDFDLYHLIACGQADPVLTYPELQRLRMLQEKCLLITNPAGRATPLDLVSGIDCYIPCIPATISRPLKDVLHEALFWVEELVTCPDAAAPWNH